MIVLNLQLWYSRSINSLYFEVLFQTIYAFFLTQTPQYIVQTSQTVPASRHPPPPAHVENEKHFSGYLSELDKN